MNYAKNEVEFIAKYGDAGLQWFKTNYPVLKNFDLPIPYETLKDFYLADYKYRRLKPEPAYLDNYELLFSYFLANYGKPLNEKQVVKSDLEYLFSNIGAGVKRTISQITSNVDKVIPLLILFMVYKIVKD
ncbi:hypothetical protein MROS_2529 [Melioribacter roseus P3M-2]|jgi:hypothetical protein|uniref:Uncharacterized protein n=1 Tax=Melioribacter roseus (strain DSM 23840 / JCM 17771 / VKM B-2668 / P3M-2) TaxID=1191523 RepID=I6ZUR6_MELRP|nr:hypothetical protein [Melioribacter roseus]AFN75759.1 hypothetical protein MROS_2529 [Melioribacter roseus P3M-2]